MPSRKREVLDMRIEEYTAQELFELLNELDETDFGLEDEENEPDRA